MSLNLNQFLESGAIVSIDDKTAIVGFGKNKKSSQFSKSSFYFPDFFLLNLDPWIEYENTVELTLEELEESILQIDRLSPKAISSWQMTDKCFFDKTFLQLKELFVSSGLRKAVPYILEKTDFVVDKLQLMHSLKSLVEYVKKYPAYIYGFWNKNEGVLGATPEILFRLHGKQLETMACAGTRKSGQDGQLLMDDPKEMYEHQLVIQGICEVFESQGQINVGKTMASQLNQLVHLITPICIQLNKKINFEAAVQALHPTPALGAYPRGSGDSWLRQYAKSIPRGRFGAPVGVKFDEHLLCLVGIRNMQWMYDGTSLYAGCGIVPESQCDLEWKELQLKLNAIKDLLHLV